MKPRPDKLLITGFIFLCICVVSCKQDAPTRVIKPAEMENLLYDYQIAVAMSNNLPYEELYKKPLYVDYVFKKHHVTRQEFDSSMEWYTRQAKELSKIYVAVNKRLKDRENGLNHQIAMRDKKPQVSAKGDTVDVWYADRVYRLTGSPLNNKLLFSVPADENFNLHDALALQMHYTFLPLNARGKAVVSMQIHYSNDSLLSVTEKISGSGLLSLRLKSDSAYAIKQVNGFVYYESSFISNHFLLLNQISLLRYHETAQERDLRTTKTSALKTDSVKLDSVTVKKAVQEEEMPTEETIPATRLSPKEMNRSYSKKR